MTRPADLQLPGALRTALRSPVPALVIRVALLLVAYVVLERWLLSAARLPLSSYAEPFLALEVAKRFLVRPTVSPSYALRMGLLVLFALIAVFHFRRLWVPWSSIEQGNIIRVIVVVSASVLAWSFATYDYNLFFDRAHLLDRVGLVALAGLLVWRPVFVLPFAMAAVAIIWQFTYPITPYSVGEQFLLVRLLVLFFAFFVFHTLWRQHRASDLIFLVVTLLGASFFVGGVGKIRLGWFTDGHVGFLLPATYANGWLGFLGPDAIGNITRRLVSIDWIMVGTTFAVECGAILCLWRRRLLLGYLGAWMAFHLGVFAVAGIFFWKWSVLEATLLVLLLRNAEAPALSIFSRQHFILSIVCIAGGVYWFAPVNLSWYNAPVSYTYRFEAIGESGRRFSLPPSFFAPYDYQFTQSGFGYLSPHRQLPIMWGATWDRNTAQTLARTRDPDDVEALERDRGDVFQDRARAAELHEFVNRFIGNYNRRRSKATFLSALRAPPQLWTFPKPDAFRGEEPIAEVVIHQVTSFYDGRAYLEPRSREVDRIVIP